MHTDKTSAVQSQPERGVYAASTPECNRDSELAFTLTQQTTLKRAKARAPHPCLSVSIRG
jgi:hypothetical protein